MLTMQGSLFLARTVGKNIKSAEWLKHNDELACPRCCYIGCLRGERFVPRAQLLTTQGPWGMTEDGPDLIIRPWRNHLLEDVTMNWDQIAGNWKQLKGQIRKKWGDLTDDDFDRIAGNRDMLVGRIQERYGISKEQAERQVKEFERDSRF
jgi:uncharacterized protein YjbJ (UPF0337 family)